MALSNARSRPVSPELGRGSAWPQYTAQGTTGSSGSTACAAEIVSGMARHRGITVALVDQVWRPTITQLAEKLDVLTANFTYVRWIGDGKGIEKQTKTWDKLIVNRERETQTWVRYVRQFLHRGEVVYAYYNNHYSGFGPGSIAVFNKIWKKAAATPTQ
jgi:uncharacterized protein YecE (DUF72 family)